MTGRMLWSDVRPGDCFSAARATAYQHYLVVEASRWYHPEEDRHVVTVSVLTRRGELERWTGPADSRFYGDELLCRMEVST